MAITLYRKYRPQRFGDIVGQRSITTTLTAELESKRIAHAYFFVGPRGVGKTTTARIFAKAVNCSSPKGIEPDNTCPSCTAINQGRSLDLIEIDAASHTQVDHVRENILPAARTAPTTGAYKVFIIDEVHMLSVSAFNALLKMLEEPPAHVIFILATTEPHRVPETIISRCQRFDFRRVSPTDIVSRLTHLIKEEQCTADQAVLDRVARAADGSLRDAEGILGQLIGLGEKHITDDFADLVLPRSDFHTVLELTNMIAAGRTLDALLLVQKLVDEGVRISYFFRECIELMRALLLLKMGMTSALPPLSKEDLTWAQQLIASIPATTMTTMLETFMIRERDQRTTSIPQLPLELAIVELTAGTGMSAPAGTDMKPPGSPAGMSPRPPAALRKHNGVMQGAMNIITRWPDVLAGVAATHPSVAFLLKTSTPCDIVDGVLTLSFPYAFHSERLLDARNKGVVENVLSSVIGTHVEIETVVSQESPAPAATEDRNDAKPIQNTNDDVWTQALKTFGGSMVPEGDQPPA